MFTLKSGAAFAATSFMLTQREAIHFFKQGGVALERGVSVKRDSVKKKNVLAVGKLRKRWSMLQFSVKVATRVHVWALAYMKPSALDR